MVDKSGNKYTMSLESKCKSIVVRNGQGYICGRKRGHYGSHRMSVVWQDKESFRSS